MHTYHTACAMKSSICYSIEPMELLILVLSDNVGSKIHPFLARCTLWRLIKSEEKSPFHNASSASGKLDRLPFDTLWVLQPENRRYLSGFKAADGQLTESSGSLLISKNSLMLVTDSRYTMRRKTKPLIST